MAFFSSFLSVAGAVVLGLAAVRQFFLPSSVSNHNCVITNCRGALCLLSSRVVWFAKGCLALRSGKTNVFTFSSLFFPQVEASTSPPFIHTFSLSQCVLVHV